MRQAVRTAAREGWVPQTAVELRIYSADLVTEDETG